MTVQIRLDAQALASLFPEGTIVRAELQSAVIAEFTRKHIKETALGADVAEQIERARTDALAAVKRACAEVAEKATADLGFKKDWHRVVPSADVTSAIRTAARAAVDAEISKNIKEHVDALAEKLRGTIAHDVQAAINRLLDKEIAAAVKSRVNAVVEGLGKAA